MEPRRSTTTEDGGVGPDVWSGPGIKILGTPVGDDKFVRRLSEERNSKEEHLWRAIVWVPNPSPMRPDALHMIVERLPEVANRVADELNEGEDLEGCLAEVPAAADWLDRQGSWSDLVGPT